MPKVAEPVPTDVVLPKGPVTAEFRASIDKALADMIPPGRRSAAIGVATQDGMVVGFATRINDRWTIGADVEKQWGGDLTGRVMVVGAW